METRVPFVERRRTRGTWFHFARGSFDGISVGEKGATGSQSGNWNIIDLGHPGITLHFRYRLSPLSANHKSSRPQRDNNSGQARLKDILNRFVSAAKNANSRFSSVFLGNHRRLLSYPFLYFTQQTESMIQFPPQTTWLLYFDYDISIPPRFFLSFLPVLLHSRRHAVTA